MGAPFAGNGGGGGGDAVTAAADTDVGCGGSRSRVEAYVMLSSRTQANNLPSSEILSSLMPPSPLRFA